MFFIKKNQPLHHQSTPQIQLGQELCQMVHHTTNSLCLLTHVLYQVYHLTRELSKRLIQHLEFYCLIEVIRFQLHLHGLSLHLVHVLLQVSQDDQLLALAHHAHILVFFTTSVYEGKVKVVTDDNTKEEIDKLGLICAKLRVRQYCTLV